MKNELRLPADYAVMTEDEMTYTEGGSAAFDTFKVAATVVGSVCWAPATSGAFLPPATG